MSSFDYRGIGQSNSAMRRLLDRQSGIPAQSAPILRSNAPNGVVEFDSESEVTEFFRYSVNRTVANANYTLFHIHITNAESESILQDNVRRTFLKVTNNSTDFIYLNFGQDASQENGDPIAPGETASYDPPPVNSVQLIGALPNQQHVTIIEGST